MSDMVPLRALEVALMQRDDACSVGRQEGREEMLMRIRDLKASIIRWQSLYDMTDKISVGMKFSLQELDRLFPELSTKESQ